MRLHMQPVCNQRAANRPAVLRVTVSICLSPAGTDMRYMHIHTHTRVQVYIPYTCKTHGSAQSLDGNNDSSFVFRSSDLDPETQLKLSSHKRK